MLMKVSEQVIVEHKAGTTRNGNTNEGIHFYRYIAKLNLHCNSKYGTLLITKTQTTKAKHAAGINITFWEYSNNFIKAHNVNQLFNVLEIYQRNRHIRTA
jgi:hypothetical protein